MSYNLQRTAEVVRLYSNNEYPRMVGKMAMRFMEENFRRQAWEGVPWKRRKGGKRNHGRALLINRGILRRGNAFRVGNGEATVYNNVKYAKAHNEGFSGNVSVKGHNRRKFGRYKASSVKTKKTSSKRLEGGVGRVKAHNRRMRLPRRQFAPTASRPSPTFTRQVERQVTTDIMKILKQQRK